MPHQPAPPDSPARKIVRNFLQSVFCFVVVWTAGYLVSHLFYFAETLNPLANKIDDFELSDLCFAYGHKQVDVDKNILVFRSDSIDNNTIAVEISTMEKNQVRAIAIDLIFNSYIPNRDNALIDTINQYKANIVLATSYDDAQRQDSRDKPFYAALRDRNTGSGTYNWGYLKELPEMATQRYFEPQVKVGARNLESFEVKTLQVADDSALNELFKRGNSRELINYHRGYKDADRYFILDQFPVNPAEARGKIILYGSIDTNSIADRYYTPLNRSIGRSYPDMDGVVYHAQVLSMILDNDFINEASPFVKYLTTFLCIFFSMFFFNAIIHLHNYYHLLSELFFLIVLIPISFTISLFFLNRWHLKIEPTTYIVPVFFSGIALHFYEPFVKLMSSLWEKFNNKKRVYATE